jgi:hypothetical protein
MMAQYLSFGDVMSLKPMQIYLTEEEHAALQRAADRSGCSMTAIVRDLVDRYLLESGPPPSDLTDLAGIVATAEPTDIATEKDRLLYEGLLDDIRRHERPVRVAES